MDLRTVRKEAGLSQYTIAQRAGISRMRLSLAECGEIELQPSEIDSIRKALGVEIEKRAGKLQSTLSKMESELVSA